MTFTIDQQLKSLDEKHLRRKTTVMESWIDLSSNDYLGLSRDPRVKQAAVEAIETFGTGARGARLMSGTLAVHEELEHELAALFDTEAALVFGSGFLTNVGVLSALLEPGDHCFADRLNHASLVDGMRLSGAKFHRYRHADTDNLRRKLEKTSCDAKQVIVSDSVFSMDGDAASVDRLSKIALEFNALLIVDEAHALGVLGPGGGGLCRELPKERRPDLVVGTLSKSLGSYGGCVGCSASMREYLVNCARSFIFSTALPPASAAAALAAIRIIRKEKTLGQQLLEKTSRFRVCLQNAGLNIPECQSPIIPVQIGDNESAMRLARQLRTEGLLVTAIRPPTVPPGTARLRLSVSLAHRDEDLKKAATMIGTAAKEEGLL